MSEDIPEWAVKRADDLAYAADGFYSTAFARYIAEHEQPPVDEDLMLARDIVDGLGRYSLGTWQGDIAVSGALAAIKATRERMGNE